MVKKVRALRFAQLNLQSLLARGRVEALQAFLINCKIDICAVQETWLKQDAVPPTLEGYHWVSVPRPGDPHGGVGFLVQAKIEFKIVKCITNHHKNTKLETVEIVVSTREGSLRIINVYCPPRSNDKALNTTRTMEELERHLINCGPPGRL